MTTNLSNILNIAATGMSANNIRMNLVASNLANAGSMGSTEATTYHAKFPVFQEITQSMLGANQVSGGVKVANVINNQKPLQKIYDPTNPLAGKDGFVYVTDVNHMQEMTNLIEASKDYQASIEVMNTAKNLMNQTIAALNTR